MAGSATESAACGELPFPCAVLLGMDVSILAGLKGYGNAGNQSHKGHATQRLRGLLQEH